MPLENIIPQCLCARSFKVHSQISNITSAVKDACLGYVTVTVWTVEPAGAQILPCQASVKRSRLDPYAPAKLALLSSSSTVDCIQLINQTLDSEMQTDCMPQYHNTSW